MRSRRRRSTPGSNAIRTGASRSNPGDLILVVDIGGGTTDFTLIAVIEQNGELQLERVAVGEHLLLGGDNMDLAVARFAEQQFSRKGIKLDAMQFHSLWQQCRAAKELLLSSDENAPARAAADNLGAGQWIGRRHRYAASSRATKYAISCWKASSLSFPPMPFRSAARRIALTEVGLNYAADAAVTKHLAQFLRTVPRGTSQAHSLSAQWRRVAGAGHRASLI